MNEPSQPAPVDWAIFALLVAIGGSSFAMIRIAVESVPPVVVTVARLWIGASVMYAAMRAGGLSFPPIWTRAPDARTLAGPWRWWIAVGAVGYAIPFLLYPWAQQYIPSGLAGVYMALMPIWTLVLAAAFASERVTPARAAGFALGLAGVVFLIGPDVVTGAARSSLLAQGGLLIATFCYAAAAVLSKRAPRTTARQFAAATTLCGAAMVTPALLFTAFEPASWTLKSALAVLGLGLGPTGLAGLLIILLINRVGAGFMALANYLTPVCAVLIGSALFGERIGWTAAFALGVILCGVFIGQRGVKR